MHKELEWMWKDVVMACLKYNNREKPMKICQVCWCHDKIKTRYYHLN